MRWISSKTARWAATAFFTACWAYALVTRFTNIFLALRPEKMTMLGVAMVATSLVSVFIFHKLLPRITREIQLMAALKTAALSALAAAALLLFVFQPLYFPEHHLLEIMPHPPSDGGNLTVITIHRIELPGGEKLGVPPSIIDLQGNWHMDSGSDTITWTGDPEAKISYPRLMQAGIEILFKVGPQEGKVRILWDGQEHFINLDAPIESTQSIVLMPALDWHRADLTRKILVGVARMAEFLGLSALICILAFLPKVIKIRNARTIIIIAGALLLLIPLVYAVDPPVQFQDSNLEAAVRDMLNQPEGTLRQHKLLTIAKLDASSYQIADLEGIQHLRNLAFLNLRDNSITDITQLSTLVRLADLNLRGNAVSDIAPLAALTNLESLNLRNNSITDLTPLVMLTNLRELNLYGIQLRDDIALLKNYPNLMRLNVRSCGISDLSLLAELMARGILQDDPSGLRAEVDIRDNPIPRQPTDGYAPLRPYWENITDRVPYVLPVFITLETPSFSHTGGFHETGFSLELSTQDPQAVIHYTLDGSEPSQGSPLYDQPLRISNRAGEPDVYSQIGEISPHWKEPIGEVFKATVVRVKAFYLDGSYSAIATHTYFVDQDMSGRYSLPIVSISVEPDHFFDYLEGIYVKGIKYDEGNGHITGVDANYWESGGQWERPIHIEFFDTSGERYLAQDGGVRIHGSNIRTLPQKSLRIYADDQYGQSDNFSYEFFPGLRDAVQNDPIREFKVLLLRNSGTLSSYPIFRDTIMHTLLDHTSLDILTYHPVIVFLNGEYWGLYNLRETMNEHYLKAHYQIDPDKAVVLEKKYQLSFGTKGDEAHYLDLLNYIIDNNISEPEHYSYISTKMDIDNFIDYQITEIYSANRRWPFDNIKYWRYKTDEYQPDAPYGQDGRWRWFLFDLDTAFGYGVSDIQEDTLLRATGEFLLRSLLGNSDFRIQFINRFADHLNTSFTPQRFIGIIDEMQGAIDREIPEHMRRWNVMGNSIDFWEETVDVMRDFANERPAFTRQHIKDYFNLPGTAVVTLKTDSDKGYIRINSIDITADTPGVMRADEWNGIYFKGVPIKLTAIPNSGYKFTGWEGIEQSGSEVIIELDEDQTLTANFIIVDP